MTQLLSGKNRLGKEHPDRKEAAQCLRWLGKRKGICVLAPVFTPENERDGYIHRVKTVDESLLGGYARVYLMGDEPGCDHIRIRYIDDAHVYVRFDSFSPRQRRAVFRLIRRCGKTYIHSVYRFMAGYVAREMTRMLFLPGVRHIWDVHGAVPEECCMNGDPGIGAVAAKIEKRLFHRASVILCVNRAMEEHLRTKYGHTKARFRIFSILGVEAHTAEPLPEKPVGPLRTVYAGGLQSWQCIGRMQDLMAETMGWMSYKILTPEPEAFLALWGDRPPMENVSVGTCAPEKITEEYAPCHYGLLLREDSPVNRVACPTKLIEYIQCGIVPVLSFAEIGDFAAQGMKYITDEAFARGDLPEETERRRMAEENRRILRQMEGIREWERENEQI